MKGKNDTLRIFELDLFVWPQTTVKNQKRSMGEDKGKSHKMLSMIKSSMYNVPLSYNYTCVCIGITRCWCIKIWSPNVSGGQCRVMAFQVIFIIPQRFMYLLSILK